MAQNFTATVELALPASRLWAALKSFYLIFPNLTPETGDTMEVIEGTPGEAGSVNKMTLGATKGGPLAAFAKERLEIVDNEKMIIATKEIEAGHLAIGFTKWQTTTQLVPMCENKVKMEILVEYECDPSDPVCDMVLEQNKESIPLTFKAVEAYLLTTNQFVA